MKSYSQYGEDLIILAALPMIWEATRLRFPEISQTGTFLDIGAWHPTIFSNTRALIERGWSGVIIEPSPGPFINLMRACVVCGDVPAEVHVEVDGRMPIPPMVCAKCGGTRYGVEERLTFILAGVGLEAGLVQMKATHDALRSEEHTSELQS